MKIEDFNSIKDIKVVEKDNVIFILINHLIPKIKFELDGINFIALTNDIVMVIDKDNSLMGLNENELDELLFNVGNIIYLDIVNRNSLLCKVVYKYLSLQHESFLRPKLKFSQRYSYGNFRAFFASKDVPIGRFRNLIFVPKDEKFGDTTNEDYNIFRRLMLMKEEYNKSIEFLAKLAFTINLNENWGLKRELQREFNKGVRDGTD